MKTVPIFPWTRYWFRRGDSPTLADDYLVPPNQKATWLSTGQTATLKTLSELAEVPCLVLLGDPGTGKSSEILTEAAQLRATAPGDIKVKRLDLKLRTESLIEKEVFKREEFIGWTEGRHALVLFFDSMDECWRRVPELGPVILAELEPHLTKELPPLYLRLGCRAAEWREEIESGLRIAFGEKKKGEEVQVWELAPLTQEDVLIAATSSGLDHNKFLADVQSREVNAFASHPITLRMLLATAMEGGQLGRDRAEIYQNGCTLLCSDQHQPEKAVPRLTTTGQQRLTCASYLAALCVLSNRYIIYASFEQRPADDSGMIVAQDLLGQKTLLPEIDFELTREILAETLFTALFDAQADELFSWRHQSYAEYLSASYLQLRQIPVPEIIQSLCDTSTGEPRLWPQVEETACWLASLMPEVFNQLVGANAEVFVRCDPVRLAPDQRAQIVSGYFNQVRVHEAQATHSREVSRLNRLAHPDLAKQLAPILEDPTQDIFARDLTMDIVRACELRELTDVLMNIMFSPEQPHRLRHGAGITLRKWTNEDIRAKLKAELKPEFLDDDDVRGSVLSILWPASLTAQELVPYLTKPKQDNYVGSYQHFLAYEFPGGLGQAELVPLIKWVKAIAKDTDITEHGAYDGACNAVLLAAYQAISNAEVRAEFMAVVDNQARRYGGLFKLEGRDLEAELPSRKIFWWELMASKLPVRDTIISASLMESGLLHEDDFDWVIDEATASTSLTRDRWLELAFWLFQPQQRIEQVTRILPFAVDDAEVAERMLIYTTCSLEEKKGQTNWQKDGHYRKQKIEEERAKIKPFKQQVDEVLSSYESKQKPKLIWGLTQRLARPIKDFNEPGGGNMNDVGWKHLNEEQRTRILALSPGFISSVKVDLTEVYDSEKYYWNYVAGVSFLLLLIEAGSPWPNAQTADFWDDWTPVIIHYHERAHHVEEAVWQKLLKLAFNKAKPAFLIALTRWLEERCDSYLPIQRLALLPVGTDPELEAVLLTSAVAGKRENETEFDFFGFLLRHKSTNTEETLVSWLPITDSSVHEKAHFADALLLCFRPVTFGAQVIDRILADNEWGRNVFYRLAHMGGVKSGWLKSIDLERLARLWEWLNNEFPGDPFDDKEGDGTVTATHEIAMFRNHLIGFIGKQGTREAIEEISGLVIRHPDYTWLGQVLAQARQIMRRESWKPPAAQATIGYLARTDTPPLCNDADLADAVKASLYRYQELLKGPRPLTELWNENGSLNKIWEPKNEENSSTCLARHLERDLKHYNVTVARESELRQRTGTAMGDVPDLLVSAPDASGNGEILTVVVEVKCTWNTETVTGMEQQLLNRYLRGLHCGIYVVAHFKCDSWTENDYRKRAFMAKDTLAEVTDLLETERQRLASMTDKRLDLVVLDAAV